MTNVHAIDHLRSMSSTVGIVTVVVAGNSFAHRQIVEKSVLSIKNEYPESSLERLQGNEITVLQLEELLSPSLFGDTTIVRIDNAQSLEEDAIACVASYIQESATEAVPPACVVMSIEQNNVKTKKFVTTLKKAGATICTVPELKKAPEKKKFITEQFTQEYGRKVDTKAVEYMYQTLGDNIDECAALIRQLCFDFDDNPITLERVQEYLQASPTVTGFTLADTILQGNVKQAIVEMRAALQQGNDPIALIAIFAMKIRNIAKVQAIQEGIMPANTLQGWQYNIAKKQSVGWTSQGAAQVLEQLANADSIAKGAPGNLLFALESVVMLMARKGNV